MSDAAAPRIPIAPRTIWAFVLVLAAGCGSDESHFPANRVYLRQQELAAKFELSDQQRQDVVETVEYLFGTPNEPRIPRLDGVDLERVLQLELLQLAAGPVSSDQEGRHFGLYRKHCAHCHGLSGDGAGPSAVFLEPYPRDFRRGIFKYKATPGPLAPPTDEDLIRVLQDGNADSAMPGFDLLGDEDLAALVAYVKYLAIRGEVERAMIFESIDVLEDEHDRLVDLSLRERDAEEFASQMRPLLGIVRSVVQRWLDAPTLVTPVPPPPAGWDSPDSIDRGRALFVGQVANCVKCHGQTGRGDGENVDYDDWSREIVDPQNPAGVQAYVALGALVPRRARPRNLTRGIYRGGNRPEDLYRRIVNGIAGTPMPALPLRAADAEPDDPFLTPDDVWQLVAFVRWLGGRAETEDLNIVREITVASSK